MTNGAIIVLVLVCFCFGLFIGIGLEKIKGSELNPVMSYGYDEQHNYWNRIRVDQDGKIVCSKGE